MRSHPVSLPILLLCIFILPGCPQPADPPPEFPSHLVINFTGQNYGAMFPCGCRVPEGGLARLGGVLNSSEDALPYPAITVDAGSFASGNTPYERYNAGWILKAYSVIGYQAVNIGWIESLMPVNQVRELDALSGNMLVSANMLDGYDLPITRKYLIREVEGITIGFTGICGYGESSQTGDFQREGSEMPRIIAAAEPLNEVVAELEDNNVDFIILLADATAEELREILHEVEGIDLVIHSASTFSKLAPMNPILVNETTRIVSIGGQGRILGRLRLDFDPDGTVISEEGMVISLEPESPIQPEVSQLLYEYKLDLHERRDEFSGDPSNPFQRVVSPELTDILDGYAGMDHCRACHSAYAVDVTTTGHKGAWRVLDTEHLLDPECLECHTTGYGIPTGLVNPYLDSHLTGVTCEACHGPGGLHVMEQYIAKGELDREFALNLENPTGLPFSREVPAEICTRCHTEEWSPDFDYETWVPFVNHAPARGPARELPDAPPDLPSDE